MKNLFLNCLTTTFIVFFLFLNGCKPKAKDPAPTASVTETASAQQTDDNKSINDGLDNAINSVRDGLSNSNANGRSEIVADCGVVIDYRKFKTEKTITYTYDGTDCKNAGIIRRGTIVVKLLAGNKYSEQGAKYSADFQAFTITINGKSIALQGTVYNTNTTGGEPWGVILGPWVTALGVNYKSTVIEVTRGTANASINNVSIAGWSIAKKTTFSRVDTTWSIAFDGDTSLNGYNKVLEWGNNRYGETFYKEMTTPFSVTSKCGGFLAFLRPSGGVCKMTVIKADKKKYYINWEWLLSTSGCAEGYKLSISDDDKNSWSTTVLY
ncbi:MAG: hypothetical protein SFY32_15680 [Bacteroidota bacterium]|nr:hypothetical protein [Bacteroidota bacterium]